MKRIFLFLAAFISYSASFGQTITLQQKLYYTCKVWGFVKYYHSNVSTCNVNWDSVLVSVLPIIESAANNNEFNDALDTMLAAAGPMALSTTYFPDTLAPELKRNRNFGWIGDPVFRTDVQTILDTIKNNFRPHPECWVQNNTFTTSYDGYLVFPYDTVLLNTNTYTSYPDAHHRLLLMFKHWNIINYFDPYTYVFDKPMDTILYNNVLPIDTVSTSLGLYLAIRKITSAFDDAHVEGFTTSEYYPYTGYYAPELMLNYIQGKYVVVKSGVSAVPVGDAIISVNGLTASQWEDSLQNYVSAGNSSVFRRFMCQYLLCGNPSTTVNVVYADTTGATGSATLSRSTYIYGAWFPEFYYPADSLNTVNWTTMNCGVGYMNIGNLSVAGTDSAYDVLQNAPAIIVDLRNYPISNSAWELADRMYGNTQMFSKLTVPDVTYPGTFYWLLDSLGVFGNATPYLGTVILLFNEETQSAAEFDCMILDAMPKVIKIGSQTAGTDGNTTYFLLSQDIESGFTSLGVYYPNGDSTERIGIVPDSIATPTIAGIMQGRDEVLEKALQVGCSIASVSVPGIIANKPAVSVFPNPVTDIVTVQAANITADKITIQITDITGRVLLQEEVNNNNRNVSTSFDIKALSAGMYFVILKTETQQYVTKIVKE